MTTEFIVRLNGPNDVTVLPATDDTDSIIAHGHYAPSLESIGWDVFKVETNGDYADEQQAYAAGFFEGFTTGHRIPQHFENTFFWQPIKPEVSEFLQANLDWLDENLPSLKEEDGYWLQVSLLMDYFNGMHAGIEASGETFSRTDLFQLAALADIQAIDASLAAAKKAHVKWHEMNKADFEDWFHQTTHCSALLKLTEDKQDIYFGHATWIFWPWMTRVFKHITLNYNAPSARAKTITLSSWAGAMSSYDDFYMTSAGLTVFETSFQIFKPEVWLEAKVGEHPDRLLYWMRAMVANRMADDGASWVEAFSQNNGGTYNNEWYVLDRKLFEPGKEPVEGLLTVLNQMPTMIRSQDMSEVLWNDGYVASYNVPVIKEIYEAAGYPEAVEKQGPGMLSYEDCARAKIFRRDHGKVFGMASMKFLMQYNDYENDPFSEGNPMYAIASRGDKIKGETNGKPNAYTFGAIDAKVSNIALAKEGTVEAFSGPTPQQGPLSFDSTTIRVGPHAGVPTVPNFDWVRMEK